MYLCVKADHSPVVLGYRKEKMLIANFVAFVWMAVSCFTDSAKNSGVLLSTYAPADTALSADPDGSFWKTAPQVVADRDKDGNPVPDNETEIRSRWTNSHLYLLFICHYQVLNLKPDPDTAHETNHLWDWDVAEAFIGDDFKDIKRYKEFEMSPQGEWVDLDIDVDPAHKIQDVNWNSGFKVKARVDSAAKIWYGEMRIPFSSILRIPPAEGQKLRINLYRAEGEPPDRKLIAWQPTHSPTFHVPESFGLLRLVK